MDLTVKNPCPDVAAAYIDIPLANWTTNKSWLISWMLVDRGVIRGEPLIGTRRKLQRVPDFDESNDIYTIENTQYGWILLEDGNIIDPCRWQDESAPAIQEPFRMVPPGGCYMNGVNPVTCALTALPEHYSSDEIYPLRRGVVRDICSRILNIELHNEGLTMSEAAYVATQPLNVFGVRSRLMYEYFISQGLSRLLPLTQVHRVHPLLAKKAWNSFYNDTDTRTLRDILSH